MLKSLTRVQRQFVDNVLLRLRDNIYVPMEDLKAALKLIDLDLKRRNPKLWALQHDPKNNIMHPEETCELCVEDKFNPNDLYAPNQTK
jgi:hypothetical protein